MRKHMLPLLLIALVLALAPPAHADPPERSLPPEQSEATFVVQNCGFDVEL